MTAIDKMTLNTTVSILFQPSSSSHSWSFSQSWSVSILSVSGRQWSCLFILPGVTQAYT